MKNCSSSVQPVLATLRSRAVARFRHALPSLTISPTRGSLLMSVSVPNVNYWYDKRCARAFWSQRELPPYRELLADTAAWLDPAAGEHWLDLGCGSGQLTCTLWEKSNGSLAAIVAVDCAAANEQAISTIRAHSVPPASTESIRFHQIDFSDGLSPFASGSLDGVVSGLAIQYAQHFCRRGPLDYPGLRPPPERSLSRPSAGWPIRLLGQCPPSCLAAHRAVRRAWLLHLAQTPQVLSQLDAHAPLRPMAEGRGHSRPIPLPAEGNHSGPTRRGRLRAHRASSQFRPTSLSVPRLSGRLIFVFSALPGIAADCAHGC